MSPLPFLAEDYSGCYPASLTFFGIIATVGLISLYPSNRGHWSGPAMAWPAILLSFLGTVMLIIGLSNTPQDVKVDFDPIIWLTFLSPMITGIASLILHSIRKPPSY